MSVIESKKYPSIVLYGSIELEKISALFVDIEIYSVVESPKGVYQVYLKLMGSIKEYTDSQGVIDGFYVEACEVNDEDEINRWYSFESLDDAMELIAEIKANVKTGAPG